MSLEIIETGEVIEPMSKVEAERITARIADKLDGIADNLEQVLGLIGEALTRQAWSALGYASPTAYVSERFSGALGRLPIETRRSVVGELSAAGMSTRAIAPIVGASKNTVARDISATVPSGTVAPDRKVISLDGRQRPASQPKPEPESLDEWRGRVLHDATVNGKIVKLTGPNSVANPGPAINRTTGEVTDHQYQPARRRQPLPDAFLHQAIVARKAVEALERLVADDRFPRNRGEVSAVNGRDLTLTKDALQRVIGALNK